MLMYIRNVPKHVLVYEQKSCPINQNLLLHMITMDNCKVLKKLKIKNCNTRIYNHSTDDNYRYELRAEIFIIYALSVCPL